MTFITDALKQISFCVIGGGTEHVADEIRRAFDDAVGVVSVVEDGAVLTGGGSVLAALSRDLRTC